MRMTFVDTIQSHPTITLIVMIVNVLFAEYVKSIEIPLIFMQLIQLVVWGVTITVGTITIYGFFKKKKKK